AMQDDGIDGDGTSDGTAPAPTRDAAPLPTWIYRPPLVKGSKGITRQDREDDESSSCDAPVSRSSLFVRPTRAPSGGYNRGDRLPLSRENSSRGRGWNTAGSGGGRSTGHNWNEETGGRGGERGGYQFRDSGSTSTVAGGRGEREHSGERTSHRVSRFDDYRTTERSRDSSVRSSTDDDLSEEDPAELKEEEKERAMKLYGLVVAMAEEEYVAVLCGAVPILARVHPRDRIMLGYCVNFEMNVTSGEYEIYAICEPRYRTQILEDGTFSVQAQAEFGWLRKNGWSEPSFFGRIVCDEEMSVCIYNL
ncbi:hypothetical protein PENTCL1PPCAC_9962, partial [Pristionchus entomophagus]